MASVNIDAVILTLTPEEKVSLPFDSGMIEFWLVY